MDGPSTAYGASGRVARWWTVAPGRAFPVTGLSSTMRMPVQYEPNDIHSLPSARTTAGSMAFQESVVSEVKTLPWSVQVPGRPDGEVATPIAEWLVPQEETA